MVYRTEFTDAEVFRKLSEKIPQVKHIFYIYYLLSVMAISGTTAKKSFQLTIFKEHSVITLLLLLKHLSQHSYY
jgi:hypothetical protein